MYKNLPGRRLSRPSKNKIKYTFSLAITIIGLLSLFVGTSYAILRGIDTSDNEQVIKSGSIELKLTEKFENINKKITVMSDVEGLVEETTYDFNLKNIGSESAKFDIKLVNEVPSNYTGKVLDLDYFKVGLEINGEEHGPISLKDSKGIIDSDIIYKGEIINYKMRIWLDEEKEKELKEMEDYKAFLKLEVEAEQRVEEMDKGVEVTTYSYTGDVQEYEVMRDGYYKIEAWGAQGGGGYISTGIFYKGGSGSYTSGEIYLEAGEKLYIYVGGKGIDGASGDSNARLFDGGYNGGGNGYSHSYSGGGATDIRLVKGQWNNEKSLRSRIMVAAGGGGASSHSTGGGYCTGGSAGGLNGYNSVPGDGSQAGTGGTQTSGYAFGSGQTTTSTASSGGGGGYYGGKAGACTSTWNYCAGGGSSYISGHTGCVAVTSQDSTTPKSGCTTGTTDNSCSIHYSNNKFINTVMIDGSGYDWGNVKNGYQKMPKPSEKNSYYNIGTGNEGDGFVKITYLKNEKEQKFEYTGNVQEYITPESGYYYIELSGAQGGHAGTISGKIGKGSKTSGYIYLKRNEKLYFYIGGQSGPPAESQSAGRTGGWNGGGNGALSTYNNRAQGGGGGATDVRLVSGSWNDTASLISRIMVAGGGGGQDYYGSEAGSSYLFGTSGNLARYSADYAYPSYTASGGTQTSGGNSGASFGKGGNATNYRTAGGGGGGGYYGGGAGGGETAGSGSGAGGSSYISGFAGVNSVKESTTITHTGQTLHYSGKYFLGGYITPQNNLGNGYAKIKYIGSKLKVYNELDNIRYIKDCVSYNNVNSNNHWLELQAIKDGINIAKGKNVTSDSAQNSSYPYSRITDGDITTTLYSTPSSAAGTNQCITVDLESEYDLDEIAVWHYYGDKRIYNENITYASSDNKNWVKVINENTYETSNGKRVNRYGQSQKTEVGTKYDYPPTGEYSSFVVPETGKYKIELWGAGVRKDAFDAYLTAVKGTNYENYGKIGVAGYVSGEIELSRYDILYLFVGRGGYIEYNKRTANSGGYNGGGSGGAAGSNTTYKYSAGASGGGATDVRLTSGSWENATSLRSRIMVSGGAGGSISAQEAGLYSSNSGGLTSNKGYSEQGASYGGAAATQTSGSGFGTGGAGAATGGGTYCHGHGGGGGGYYGGSGGAATGGNCYMSGGGGGSSYISGHTGCVAITSASSSTPKSGCTTGTTDNSCSIHYSGYKFTNTIMIDGSGYKWTNVKGEQVKIPNPEGGYYDLTFGHDGNGYARITFLG